MDIKEQKREAAEQIIQKIKGISRTLLEIVSLYENVMGEEENCSNDDPDHYLHRELYIP